MCRILLAASQVDSTHFNFRENFQQNVGNLLRDLFQVTYVFFIFVPRNKKVSNNYISISSHKNLVHCYSAHGNYFSSFCYLFCLPQLAKVANCGDLFAP